MIEQVVATSNETIPLQDEKFLIVVDLLFIRPELDLQVTQLYKTGCQQTGRKVQPQPCFGCGTKNAIIHFCHLSHY